MLYDAKLDHEPVVAIIGQQKRIGLGSAFQQEIDPNSLYRDVASDFVQTCMVPGQAVISSTGPARSRRPTARSPQ